MANVCYQKLFISCASKEDALFLLREMASNLCCLTGVNVLDGLEEGYGWEEAIVSFFPALSEINGLCLLGIEPDSRAEFGLLDGDEVDGKPCIFLNLDLKWSPSFLLSEFCKRLDPDRYGFATICGGDYVYAMGDGQEVAFIQFGEGLGDPHSGPVDYAQFSDWKSKALSSTAVSLHEIALKCLFQSVPEFIYFSEGDIGDIDWNHLLYLLSKEFMDEPDGSFSANDPSDGDC